MKTNIRRVGGSQAQGAKRLGLVKVTRASAKALFDAGIPIVMVGNNVNDYHFFGGWGLAYTVNPAQDPEKYTGQFDSIANSMEFYLEPELGRRVCFFVKENSL